MQDIRQSREWQAYMESIGWEVVHVNNIVGYKQSFSANEKSIPILGSILKFPRCPMPKNLNAVIQAGKAHNAFLIKLEPIAPLPRQSLFCPNTAPTMPTKTIWIDLQQSREKLWSSVRPSTRTKINKAKRLNIEIATSHNINQFAQQWVSASKQRGVWTGQKAQIEKLWQAFPQSKKIIVLARKNAAILAGILLLLHDKTAYYMYAFTSKTGQQFPAAHLLAWNAIVLSKKRGNTRFDFEGIYDEKSPKSWKGFTFFKQGFNGQEISFPHAYTITFGWANLPFIRNLF